MADQTGDMEKITTGSYTTYTTKNTRESVDTSDTVTNATKSSFHSRDMEKITTGSYTTYTTENTRESVADTGDTVTNATKSSYHSPAVIVVPVIFMILVLGLLVACWYHRRKTHKRPTDRSSSGKVDVRGGDCKSQNNDECTCTTYEATEGSETYDNSPTITSSDVPEYDEVPGDDCEYQNNHECTGYKATEDTETYNDNPTITSADVREYENIAVPGEGSSVGNEQGNGGGRNTEIGNQDPTSTYEEYESPEHAVYMGMDNSVYTNCH